MKKDWTKKCTCENFQQNEDCEHIGDKVLEEFGMPVEKVHDSMGTYHIADTHIEEQPESVDHDHGTKEHPCHIHDGGDDSGLVDCRGCEKQMLKHLNNKWVGLAVGDKDCPDCLPYDGCAKHYIKNGDRHNRLQGALTPLGEKLAEIKKKIIEKSTFEPGVSSNGWYQIYKDDLDSIL